MKQHSAHKNAAGNVSAFDRHFLETRLAGFEKDLDMCLKPVQSRNGRRLTNAYFPALGACFGYLEYVAGLFRGSFNGIGWPQIADWSNRFLPQPDYDRAPMRIFFNAFRYSVAHRGIATGVWVDRPETPHLRVTWKVRWPCRHRHETASRVSTLRIGG
jgi:hypothetical protein